LLKYRLLDRALAIGGNHDDEELAAIKSELTGFFKDNTDDAQIHDALLMLKIAQEESKSNDFEECCIIAAPILNRLSRMENWDFYDIRILSGVIDYAETFEQVIALMNEAIKRLNDYSEKQCYAKVKLALYMNAMLRMLRAKYFNMDNLNPSKELENTFAHYAKEATALCDEDTSGVQPSINKAVIDIRKGVFYRDNELIDNGFKSLKQLGADGVYRMLQAATAEFNYFTELTISKRQFNVIVGANLKKERLAHDMKQEELARILGVTIPAIGLMERGERSITSRNLGKFAYIFEVPIDTFYQGIGGSNTAGKHRSKYQKLVALAKGLEDYELDYVVAVIKNLPQPQPKSG
jgi:transcriptional regulator with XRE-family HTH domain